MTKLTKDQIKKLTPEQQLVVGELELRQMKKYEECLRKAKGSRFQILLGAVVMALAPLILLAINSNIKDRTLVVCMFCMGCMYTGFQARSLAKRQDALLELILKSTENSNTLENK